MKHRGAKIMGNSLAIAGIVAMAFWVVSHSKEHTNHPVPEFDAFRDKTFALFLAADKAAREHDYKRAERLYLQQDALLAAYIRKHPGGVGADSAPVLGDLMLREGRRKEAYRYYRQMLRNPIDASKRTAPRLLAYAHLAEEFGQPQEAAAAYQTILEQSADPRHPRPIYFRAVPPLPHADLAALREQVRSLTTPGDGPR